MFLCPHCKRRTSRWKLPLYDEGEGAIGQRRAPSRQSGKEAYVQVFNWGLSPPQWGASFKAKHTPSRTLHHLASRPVGHDESLNPVHGSRDRRSRKPNQYLAMRSPYPRTCNVSIRSEVPRIKVKPDHSRTIRRNE